MAIKTKVEKLLKFGFIYHVPLTEWVSNIIPVAKKQGTIHVCIDYQDLNKACPKYNYPTPFIDQIILPDDQHKTSFIFPWGTFSYQKLPFGLKNA
jgi:hypothetical protein